MPPIQRYRSKAPPEITAAPPSRLMPKPKAKRVPTPKPKSTFDFAFVAREILLRPPLRHRGEPPEAGLSVFDFCIGVAATILARRARAAKAHHAGLRAGKRAMTAKRNQEQPVHNKAESSPYEQFDYAGNAGFETGRARYFKDHAHLNWPIETSRAELLRCAALDRKSANNLRVSGALDRLTSAAGDFSSVLARWDSGGERLKLVVRNEWLELQRYRSVPLPLPTSGPVVLALYLFLIAIAPVRATITNPIPRRPSRTISIASESLYGRLGIRTGRPAHDERALRTALALVNEHRRKLGQGLPAFELSDDGKGGWRFSATRRRPVKSKATRQRPVERKSRATARGSMPKSIREHGEEPADLKAEREDFRKSLALADDEWLDDDEIDEFQRREKVAGENRRWREQEEQDRELFRGFNERLLASGGGGD
jgi:hypothetical protein